MLSLRLHLVQCAALFRASSFCLQSLHSGYTIMEILKQYSKHVDWPIRVLIPRKCESKSRGSELWMLFWGVPIVKSPLTFWGKRMINTQQLRLARSLNLLPVSTYTEHMKVHVRGGHSAQTCTPLARLSTTELEGPYVCSVYVRTDLRRWGF